MTILHRGLAAAVVALSAFATASAGADVISSPGGNEVRTWGAGYTPIYGQTITGTGGSLLDFSFWLGRTSPLSSTSTPSIDFTAYLYGWNDGSGTVAGGPLFTSASSNYSATESSLFTKITFNTGGVALTPGDMYVMFFQVTGGAGGVFWESSATDQYAGGAFWFNNLADPTTMWSGPGYPNAADLRFEATITPEPASLALLGLGLAGLGLSRKRKA